MCENGMYNIAELLWDGTIVAEKIIREKPFEKQKQKKRSRRSKKKEVT